MAKSYTKTLAAGADRLVIIAEAIKSGASVYAFHVQREGKKVVSKTRGGSQKFTNMADAQAEVDAAAARAVAAGWTAPSKRGGPAGPDAFSLTALPAIRVAPSAPAAPPAPAAPVVTGKPARR